jgi:hypothetical protein
MKRIATLLLTIILLAAAPKANAQLTQVKFYYYPYTNVYYNLGTKEYLVYDSTVSKWNSVRELPDSFNVVSTPRHLITYKDTEVWRDNAAHLKKFKVKSNGEIKVKPKKE